MKFFVTVLVCAVFAVGVMAAPAPEPTAEANLDKEAEHDLAIHQFDPAYGYGDSDLFRQKKSYGAPPAPSYGAPAYAPAPAPAPAPGKWTWSAPAPHIPCSKAIVVSCAPSVIPAPCSAPSAPAY